MNVTGVLTDVAFWCKIVVYQEGKVCISKSVSTMQREKYYTDTVIVGTGVSGLFCALNLPAEQKILLITKATLEESDSFLAQGGICVLKDQEDYDSFFEDTLRAGHYLNCVRSVDLMIRSSRDVITQLQSYGVEFEKNGDELAYTREGAHSKPRILFHQDITGKEITSKLLARVKQLPNVTIWENTAMQDILVDNGECRGILTEQHAIFAQNTVLACGGIGGLFADSTNFPHLTGDALAICLRHGVPLKDVDYIQIHPTTLYTEKKGRRFLISESVRGEGAKLYDKNGNRFVNELLRRDIVSAAILKQMQIDGTKYVHLDMTPLGEETIRSHFPNIYDHCLAEGYDVTKQTIPVVPAQHYFMGGIAVNAYSKTGMEHLYAVGETACNGVHGANRLASNSLLESLVFAKRAAGQIAATRATIPQEAFDSIKIEEPSHLEQYPAEVLREIERMKKSRE